MGYTSKRESREQDKSIGKFCQAYYFFLAALPAEIFRYPSLPLLTFFSLPQRETAAYTCSITDFTDIMQVTSEVGGLPVGERYVSPEFVGLAPGFVGLAQINFQVSCLLSNVREPRIFVETLNQTRTQAITILMSEEAKASWGGRECFN